MISLIIPALNEEDALPALLGKVPRHEIDEIIVVDNGSRDGTAVVARGAGARVVVETRRGYGAACRAGTKNTECEILVFMDGDGSFDPREIKQLIAPIVSGGADLVLGSRTLRKTDARAIPLHARLGNRLVAGIVGLVARVQLTDMGPFRAIRRDVLERLAMEEPTYGWPSEMVIKASRLGCRLREVPVSYQPRTGGKSKVSGTVLGSLGAALSMLKVTVKWAFWRPHGRAASLLGASKSGADR